MENAVVLDVQDDGVGFDRDHASANGGFGLRAMRERVEELGGKLLIEAIPSEGTTLVVELPTKTSGSRSQASEKDPKAGT